MTGESKIQPESVHCRFSGKHLDLVENSMNWEMSSVNPSHTPKKIHGRNKILASSWQSFFCKL